MKGAMIGCVVLAMIAAAVYLLMGSNATAPAFRAERASPIVVSLAGDTYALGALLILVRKRWLWTAGLALNTLVLAASVVAYIQNPGIMFTLPGLATLVSQALLEAGLVYLVAAHGEIPRLAF